MVELTKFKCRQCSHEWIPRTPDPELCPKCKSRRWNVEVKDVEKSKQTSMKTQI